MKGNNLIMADIKPWLSALGFNNNCLTINGNTIEIDFENQKINYPNLKEIGRNTTINFSDEENFVVMECVIRLLKQGYTPSQISIEKGYKLGHNTKSGNADITVENNDGVPFLIIETKTYGNEFNKEWHNVLNDGGQLFSYDKQENKASVLVLYESKVNINQEITSDYRAIILKDNDEYLSSLDNPKGYKDAIGGNDRFNIWKNTYQREYVTNGILEQTIQPFTISQPKKTISDLKELTHEEVQSKYNEFATILRKYNISGHENAFDKLVNLFLAKIVDEQQNPNDLQFNWKGISQDSYYELVDRLQKLYTIGMEKFLNETVTYVSEKNIIDSFRMRQDAAKDAILKYFKELKYFSNNDFTFLEVYNEKLFNQNSKILIEIVQMLENMKLQTNHQNQFLGDLFEGYLDHGVKQSEGQFFTPLPIVKFIVSSLPLDKINQQTDIPKVLDYACGAGHFLNEYATELNSLLPQKSENDLINYYKEIYGIEKEYRLSKVSKLSTFMYGQNGINIIYGDALKDYEQIQNNSFSVIIANPPYSVKGFLETLSPEQREKYELSQYVSSLEKNNNIELFFLERAKQLLKSEGVAGIIVPSSVLSNNGIYTKTRKMLLENFDIIAITEFGSNTFSSTGTNTVTLFMRKKKYPPKESSYYKYAIERWFYNSSDLTSEDIALVEDYCSYMGYDYDTYRELQSHRCKFIYDISLFSEYRDQFSQTTTAKQINKKKITQKYSSEDRKKEYFQKEISYIINIEKEKVFYFSIVNNQKNPVVIAKNPNNNKKDEKNFLGYEWSKRKGSEGIKYIGNRISKDDMEFSKNHAINNIKTPLFNPKDLNDKNKINSIIRSNFNGTIKSIPEELRKYVSLMDLTDMIDFTQPSFDVQIKTRPSMISKTKSKFPIFKMSDKKLGINLIKGTTFDNKHRIHDESKNQILTADNISLDGQLKIIKVINIDESVKFDESKKLKKDDIFISLSSGSEKHVGKVAFINHDTNYFAGGFMGIIRLIDSTYILPKFLFEILNSSQYRSEIQNLSSGSNINNLSDNLMNLQIPVPEISIQEKILKDIDILDEKDLDAHIKIEKYQNKIKEIFEYLDNLEGDTYKLSSDDIFSLQIGKRIISTDMTNGGIPVYSSNVYTPSGFTDKKPIDSINDFSKPSILWGIDGDWMVNIIPKNTPFYPSDHTGVLRVNDISKVNPRYAAHRLEQLGQQEAYSRSNRASITALRRLSIIVPSIEQQNLKMNEVENLEAEIHNEEQKIKNLKIEKQKIIEKYFS